MKKKKDGFVLARNQKLVSSMSGSVFFSSSNYKNNENIQKKTDSHSRRPFLCVELKVGKCSLTSSKVWVFGGKGPITATAGNPISGPSNSGNRIHGEVLV